MKHKFQPPSSYVKRKTLYNCREVQRDVRLLGEIWEVGISLFLNRLSASLLQLNFENCNFCFSIFSTRLVIAVWKRYQLR